MPGLLQTPSGQFGEVKFVYALIAEFIGVMLFAFAGSATPTGNVSTQQGTMTSAVQQESGAANWAPWSVIKLQCLNTCIQFCCCGSSKYACSTNFCFVGTGAMACHWQF